MTFRDAVEKFAADLVEFETKRLLPLAAKVIGDALGPFVGSLAAAALANPAVQEKIAELELKGIDLAVDEAAKGVAELRDLICSHIGGALGKELHDLLTKSQPVTLGLTADDVRDLAKLSAAGKLREAIGAALKLVGLDAPASA